MAAIARAAPGLAGKGDRKKVFGSALEQSQQLFEAAEAVDYASRSLLLFYGVSQAGRSIAAASASTSNNDSRLVGHGIEVPNLAQRPALSDLTVIDKAWSGGPGVRFPRATRPGQAVDMTAWIKRRQVVHGLVNEYRRAA